MEDTYNYPPEGLLASYKRNFEFIILWMLKNNEVSTWSDLTEIINKSTLSIYLNRLSNSDYLEKIYQEINGKKKTTYHITLIGRQRLNALSQMKKKRKLNYPPQALLRNRIYDHWILWMVYNNNFCKWSDFLAEPLSINQSSLSKNINSLIDNGFLKKENKEYRITQLGKSAYSNMLREYDLDRQSILEVESKRIREITKKTKKFFKKFKIKDDNIKFRYLNNVLKLPYENENIKSTLEIEEDFNKVLLFLSLNHPNEFPYYIFPEDFSKKYNINLIKLNFTILRIVDEDIYPVKFFKLEVEKNKNYYFQVNEKLERMLSAIVEEHIAKFTYLHNLYEENAYETPPLTLEFTVEAILDEICGNLFSDGLRNALRKFLPDYIHYLAYKIEKEKKLIDSYDKLEGLIWQEIQTYTVDSQKINFNEQKRTNYEEALQKIDKAIKLEPKDINLYYSKSKILTNINRYREVLTLLDKMLIDFPQEEKNIQIKRAYILKEMRNVKAGLEIIEKMIEKYPKDNDLLNYKAFWLQYLNKKEESLAVIKDLIKRVPDNATYHDTYGEILMFFNDHENAIEQFQNTIETGDKNWYVYQTLIKLGICYKELGKYELAVEYLKKGKESLHKSLSDPEAKQKWIVIADLFLAEIEQLNAEF